MKPTSNPVDMTNQKLGFSGSAAVAISAFSAIAAKRTVSINHRSPGRP
jgi:hypothetical protein